MCSDQVEIIATKRKAKGDREATWWETAKAREELETIRHKRNRTRPERISNLEIGETNPDGEKKELNDLVEKTKSGNSLWNPRAGRRLNLARKKRHTGSKTAKDGSAERGGGKTRQVGGVKIVMRKKNPSKPN